MAGREKLDSTTDADTFLAGLARAVRSLGAREARALACALAERQLGVLGEDEGGARQLVARARAASGGVPPADLPVWRAELEQVTARIDPDRLTANDAYRAVAVVKLVLEACAEGATADDALAAVEAGLAARALRWPARDAAERETRRQEIVSRWAWEAVQDEARWLAALLT